MCRVVWFEMPAGDLLRVTTGPFARDMPRSSFSMPSWFSWPHSHRMQDWNVWRGRRVHDRNSAGRAHRRLVWYFPPSPTASSTNRTETVAGISDPAKPTVRHATASNPAPAGAKQHGAGPTDLDVGVVISEAVSDFPISL